MKVLVVDDDRVLAEILAFTLQRLGLVVVQAFDGRSALQRWSEEAPDLVMLDVNLPDTSGFDICRQIRQEADVPIILLTVRGEEDDIVHGLEIGADDYITKPYSPRQLLARVQAVLRRVKNSAQAPLFPSVRQMGDIRLDVQRREVTIAADDPIPLTPLETQLLDYLMVNRGHVLTTEMLIEQVWGAEGGTRSMLRQLIHRLRQKIEPDPAEPIYIETVAGLGYGFVMQPDAQ